MEEVRQHLRGVRLERQPGHATRHEHLEVLLLILGRCEGWRVRGRASGKLQVGAEPPHALDVVIAHDDALVRELGLEMKDAATVVLVGTDDRPPVGAVGMDAPDAPLGAIAQTLRFERTEDDATVLEHDRMQALPS